MSEAIVKEYTKSAGVRCGSLINLERIIQERNGVVA
jgi:hypothetical protein